MVLQLARTLGVPLRHVDAMLRAAGHDALYEEAADEVPASVREALSLLKAHHEPYPLVVVDRTYRVVDANAGALALFGAILPRPAPLGGVPPTDALAELNLALLTFDPQGARPLIVNFDEVGRELLWRIQREVLEDRGDGELQRLLDDLLAMPTVSPHWRRADLVVPSDPALILHLRVGDLDLRFLTTITAFQAPQNVAVEHLRIETWFPYDDATVAACRALGQGPVES